MLPSSIWPCGLLTAIHFPALSSSIFILSYDIMWIQCIFTINRTMWTKSILFLHFVNVFHFVQVDNFKYTDLYWYLFFFDSKLEYSRLNISVLSSKQRILGPVVQMQAISVAAYDCAHVQAISHRVFLWVPQDARILLRHAFYCTGKRYCSRLAC
jgi:hypothetical protein